MDFRSGWVQAARSDVANEASIRFMLRLGLQSMSQARLA